MNLMSLYLFITFRTEVAAFNNKTVSVHNSAQGSNSAFSWKMTAWVWFLIIDVIIDCKTLLPQLGNGYSLHYKYHYRRWGSR